MTRSKSQDGNEPEDTQQPEQDDSPATEGEVLPPGSVKLSDGRVAVVKRTKGGFDHRVDLFLGRMGYSLDGMGQIIYGRFKALLAVEFIDDQYQFFPKNKGQLEARLDMDTEDVEKISRAYIKINGLKVPQGGDDEGGDFRG